MVPSPLDPVAFDIFKTEGNLLSPLCFSSALPVSAAVGVCAIVLSALAGGTSAWAQGSSSAAGPPAVVVLAPVELETVGSEGTFVGTVMPVRRSIIGSAVDGRVIEFNVNAGQAVAQDDTLAQLRTGTIEIELSGARAEERLRAAELEELENGALPEELAQAAARLAAAEALETYARSRLDRTQELAQRSGAISVEELELARSQYRSAEQQRVEAEESLKLLRSGPRRERIAQAKARLDVQADTVRLLEDRLRKYQIRAPFDGFVVREQTEEGAWIKQGDPIAEVIDIDPVEIEVYVPEESVRFLRAGMPVIVHADAIPDREFEGTLSQIVPEADMRARTFPVKIRVPNAPENEQDLLRPGMLARASLPTSESLEGVTVPKDAVVFGTSILPDKGPIVWKNASGVAQPVAVRVGSGSGERLVVTGDLAAGDEVVIRGNERLRPGQPLQPTDPTSGTTSPASR